MLPGTGAAATAGKAFWMSLLVPGWGQYAAGRKTSAASFLLTELSLWTGYWGLGQVEAARRDHFKAYAAEHAKARTSGKDTQYFDDLGFYQDVNQHNRFALRDDGPNAVIYSGTSEFFWEWDQDESRLRYRTLRNASKTAQRQAVFVTGLVIANHLVSAVHAARSLRQVEPQAVGRPRLEMAVDPWRARLSMVLRKSFY